MMQVALLGASGGVGGLVADRLLDRGHAVVAQTRDADRLARLRDRVRVHAFDPRAEGPYGTFLSGADAAVFALGARTAGRTTLSSDATRRLVAAMAVAGLRRLVAITGVGAGETRGHGGFLYNRIVFPFVTARMYADKERQEAIIERSDLDWTIVRPAPFRTAAPSGPLRVVTDVPADLQLSAITRDEVADFVVGELETPRYVRAKPFIGHE